MKIEINEENVKKYVRFDYYDNAVRPLFVTPLMMELLVYSGRYENDIACGAIIEAKRLPLDLIYQNNKML